MIRVLILVSLGTIISAFSIPDAVDYPYKLAHLFGLDKKNADAKKERTLCETDECKYIAKVFKESMDDTVDPCDDFYDYACGNWAKNHPIPEGADDWSMWQIIGERINKQIKELIEKETKRDDIFAVKMAKQWYKSCMDVDRIEKTGLESLVNSLWRYGGWPLIMEDGEWDDRIHTWDKVDDHYARLTGYNALHDVQVRMNYWLDEPEMDLIVNVPHLSDMAYMNLLTTDPINHGDKSDENNESGEFSHETGSRELGVDINDEDDKDTENNEEDTNEDDADDEDKSEEKMLTKRKLKTKIVNDRKEKNHKSKSSKKQTGRSKTTKRIKRRTMVAKVHNKKHIKEKQIHRHNSMMKKIAILKRKQKDFDTNSEESTESSNADDENADSKEDNEENADSKEDNEENADSKEDNDENSKNNENDSNENSEDGDNDEHEMSAEINEELEQIKAKYMNVIKIVALALAETRGVEVSEEKIEKGINDLVAFQFRLVKTLNVHQIENMTLGSFQEMYDSFGPTTSNAKINWRNKIKKLFTQAGVEADDDLEIYLPIDYFKKLRVLLDETSSETLVNHVHWSFIVDMLKATSKDLRHLYYGGKDPNNDKDLMSKECIQEVEISQIMSYEYARKYFPDEVTQSANDMIDDIQKEVELQIKESTWMDDDTKHHILDKLVYMKKMVGYPDWYRNNTLVKRYFQGLTVGPSYYENILSYMRFRKWKQLREVITMENSELEGLDPLMLNAFFVPTENTIAITAADFQSPFFDFNRPWYVNFGIIGLIMAHEVNHGFDNDGRFYDKRGKTMEWLPAMAKAYNKRSQCFVDQFNNYKLGSARNVTIENYGNQTTGENIADTMGLHAVFRAYRRRERECQRPDPALPGLENLSNDQLFFLSTANSWCENADPDEVLRIARWDVHSTARLRVIGQVSNSEDFAKAFNCPVGSPMNPEKKCNIWK